MVLPRVLLVAVGGFGGTYLRDMTTRDTGAEIAGVVEVMPDIREKCPVLVERGIPVYSSLEDFYAVDHADLAVISSPIHLHTAMSLTCMRHGSNVLCEKPLCLTEEEVAQLDACCAETGRFLAVGYQLNYFRNVLAFKRDILAGKFGKPLRVQAVHAYRRGSKYYARNNWAGHIHANGREVFDSPFTNASAHNFQMLSFLLGADMESACDITGVEAELYRGNPHVENYDIAALRFATDCGATILYYTAHPHSTEELGPYGRLEFERATVTYGADLCFHAVMNDGTTLDYAPAAPTGNRHMQKLDDAIACTLHGGHPICGTKAELGHIRAVRLVQAQPIVDVDPSHVDIVEEEGRGTFYHVHNLENILLQSARAWALPHEIGLSL